MRKKGGGILLSSEIQEPVFSMDFLAALCLYLLLDHTRNLLSKPEFLFGHLGLRNSSPTCIWNYFYLLQDFSFHTRKCWHNIVDVWEALTHSAEDNGRDLDWDQNPFIGEGFHSVCSLEQHCEKLSITHFTHKKAICPRWKARYHFDVLSSCSQMRSNLTWS